MILRHVTLAAVAALAANAAHAAPAPVPRDVQFTMPAAFQGEWNENREHCGTGLNDSRLRITATTVLFYESGGPVTSRSCSSPSFRARGKAGSRRTGSSSARMVPTSRHPATRALTSSATAAPADRAAPCSSPCTKVRASRRGSPRKSEHRFDGVEDFRRALAPRTTFTGRLSMGSS